VAKAVRAHADPEPEYVLEVIRSLRTAKVYMWLDRNGWLVFQPPLAWWRPAEDYDNPRVRFRDGLYNKPFKPMRAAQKIGPTLSVYLDVIRYRDGLVPYSPAADRIEELSRSLTCEWEVVIEELANVEAIWLRTDAGSSFVDNWSAVLEETERAIARSKTSCQDA